MCAGLMGGVAMAAGAHDGATAGEARRFIGDDNCYGDGDGARGRGRRRRARSRTVATRKDGDGDDCDDDGDGASGVAKTSVARRGQAATSMVYNGRLKAEGN